MLKQNHLLLQPRLLCLTLSKCCQCIERIVRGQNTTLSHSATNSFYLLIPCALLLYANCYSYKIKYLCKIKCNVHSDLLFRLYICWTCSICCTSWFRCWRARENYAVLAGRFAVQSVVWLQIHGWGSWIQLRWAVHDASESTWADVSFSKFHLSLFLFMA